MLASVLQLLKASVPQAIALKGIAAADSKLKNFLLGAASAGYTADVALDFLRKIAGKSNRDDILNNAAFRKSQGIARPDELGSARQSEQKERLKSGAIAATGIAGGLASLLSGSGQQEPQQQQAKQEPQQQQAQQEPQQQAQQGQQAKPRFFEMAMQGVDFLSLPEKSKGMVGQLMKKLDVMESQGFSWKDRAVQSAARAIKKIVSKSGTEEQEQNRPEKVRQEQQKLSSKEELAMLIQEYKSQFPNDGLLIDE
jgi:hypothetical protein